MILLKRSLKDKQLSLRALDNEICMLTEDESSRLIRYVLHCQSWNLLLIKPGAIATYLDTLATLLTNRPTGNTFVSPCPTEPYIITSSDPRGHTSYSRFLSEVPKISLPSKVDLLLGLLQIRKPSEQSRAIFSLTSMKVCSAVNVSMCLWVIHPFH